MTNKKTLRALLASVISLLICVSMLAGSTYAWFTDKEVTGVNTISSGNLDIELYAGTVANGEITYNTAVDEGTKLFDDEAEWEPGYTEVAYLKVENKGSLALKYQLIVNVINEVIGYDENNEPIKLSEVLKYDLVTIGETEFFASRDDAMDAVENEQNLATETVDGNMASLATEYFALIVYMPTSIGNEANFRGAQAPSIQLGVSIVATQDTVEDDSFNKFYDEDAYLPKVIDEKVSLTTSTDNEVSAESDNVSLTVPAGAVAENSDVNLVVKTVEVNGDSVTYEIDLVDENGADIPLAGAVTATITLVPGLSGVTVKHDGVAMDATDYSYDKVSGVLSIITDSFSPFEIEWQDEDNGYPRANVSNMRADELNIDITYDLETAESATLDAGFVFKTTETAEEGAASEYAWWHADFVVYSDKDIAGNAVTLAGQYDAASEDYWVGLRDANTITANTEIRLMQVLNATVNYKELCSIIPTFNCGLIGDESVAGTTITVELRLYETEEPSEENNNSHNVETGKYIVISTYKYTFPAA